MDPALEIPDGVGGGGNEGDLLPDSFLALSGSIEAPADYAERHDDYIRERTERERGADG